MVLDLFIFKMKPIFDAFRTSESRMFNTVLPIVKAFPPHLNFFFELLAWERRRIHELFVGNPRILCLETPCWNFAAQNLLAPRRSPSEARTFGDNPPVTWKTAPKLMSGFLISTANAATAE